MFFNRTNSMQNTAVNRVWQMLLYKVTPPAHLCFAPVVLGFLSVCWLIACFFPNEDFGVLGLIAPLLSPLVAIFFAAWLQYRTREYSPQILKLQFRLLFCAGGLLGLFSTTALLPLQFLYSSAATYAICAPLLILPAMGTAEFISRNLIHKVRG